MQPSDRIFHEVLVDLHATVIEVHAELLPRVKGVSDGHSHSATWQIAPLDFKPGEDTIKSGVNGFGLMRTHRGAELRAALGVAQLTLDAIQMIDLAQEPGGQRLKETSALHGEEVSCTTLSSLQLTRELRSQVETSPV